MVVGLKVYKVKDKETYIHLNTVLSGWCFFKNDGENFYIKSPLNNSIEQLIEMGLITELSQDS
jgi:hypothetical protein